jgi:glycosyltransferase involved in cell wall biosynthesis
MILFLASLFGVDVYSVNNRFKRFFLRKSKFHFLGLAGVGIQEDAISHLRPNNSLKESNISNLKVAFIGRKEISKGYDVFIDIARANMDKNIEFISIGSEGDVLDSVDTKITHFGALKQHVLFHKLREIDILILPSKSEGLGMVMVECCIAGIPTITSKTDGSLQFLKHKYTGIIVERNNINYYTEAIKEIKSNYKFYSNNCIKYSIENNYFISTPIQFKW